MGPMHGKQLAVIRTAVIFRLHLNPWDSQGNPHAAVQMDEIIMSLVLFQGGADI